MGFRFRLSVFFLFLSFLSTQNINAFDHQFRIWDRITKDVVHEDHLDVYKIALDPKPLVHFLRQLDSMSIEEFLILAPQQQLAFLINLYNAYALRNILASVEANRSLEKGLDEPLDVPVLALYGRSISLASLQRTLLVGNFRDPRVHFALCHGAKSSPLLRPEAYRKDRLDKQLDEEAMNFLHNPRFNQLDNYNRILLLSPIFNWYRNDFKKGDDSVFDFVTPYYIRSGHSELLLYDYSVQYLPFDWTPNNKG